MRLDLKAVLNAVWFPFLVWTIAVISVAFVRHEPGVICVTPVAWLMAFWVGHRCVSLSRSGERSARFREAALAGAIFGLLQGLLFTVVAPSMGSIRPDEAQKAIVLDAVMIVLGAVVSAVFSVVLSASLARRLTSR
jgi:hypothetical protein